MNAVPELLTQVLQLQHGLVSIEDSVASPGRFLLMTLLRHALQQQRKEVPADVTCAQPGQTTYS